jgi:hypothetical protein
LIINFAGLGEVAGVGEVSGVGDSAGVGEVLGVVAGDVEGLDSGDCVACWPGIVQLANSKINPATTAAGTPPPLLMNL